MYKKNFAMNLSSLLNRFQMIPHAGSNLRNLGIPRGSFVENHHYA